MLANLFLAIMIFLMIIREVSMWFQHRRPFRLAFAAFWILLSFCHFSNSWVFYPPVVLALVFALVMKARDGWGAKEATDGKAREDVESPTGMACLWDGEVDGVPAGPIAERDRKPAG